MIGALLGTQEGRNVEIFNSFELQFDGSNSGDIMINMDYYRTKEEQCKYSMLFIHTSGSSSFCNSQKIAKFNTCTCEI